MEANTLHKGRAELLNIRIFQALQEAFLLHQDVGFIRQGARNHIVEGDAHLVVGKSEDIFCTKVREFGFFNGQVAGLEQDGLKLYIFDVVAVDETFADFQVFQLRDVIIVLLYEFDEECRSAGGEPVVVEYASRINEQQNIERIVYLLAQKVVPIVPIAHLVHIHSVQTGSKCGFKVMLGVATDRGKVWIQGDIFQVVESAEDGNLAELAHPGEKGEIDVAITPLDGGVDIFENFASLFGYFRLIQVVHYEACHIHQQGLRLSVHTSRKWRVSGI